MLILQYVYSSTLSHTRCHTGDILLEIADNPGDLIALIQKRIKDQTLLIDAFTTDKSTLRLHPKLVEVDLCTSAYCVRAFACVHSHLCMCVYVRACATRVLIQQHISTHQRFL